MRRSRTSSSPAPASSPECDRRDAVSSCPTSSRQAPTGGARARRMARTRVRIRPTKSFKVLAEVVLAPPIPSSPSTARLPHDLTPDFRVKAGNRSGVTPTSNTSLQVSNNSSFTSIAAIFIARRELARDAHRQDYAFLHGQTYYWRVRAWHTADGSELSNWSPDADIQDAEASPLPRRRRRSTWR